MEGFKSLSEGAGAVSLERINMAEAGTKGLIGPGVS